MYEVLKSVAQRLFPNLLTSQEETLRKVLAWKYKGNKYQCNLCSTTLSSFIRRGNGDRLCPRCGSVGRTRRLYSILKDVGDTKRVLHFSPPKSLKNKLQAFDTYQYETTDYEGEFEANYRYDIRQIDSDDAQFDLIICYHVLEHIVEDMKAISELYRILKVGGRVYIQTPFSHDKLYEDYSISSREDRLLHYGQADHVRIYTVEVLTSRFRQVGFNVELIEYTEAPDNYHGYKTQEYIIIASKV